MDTDSLLIDVRTPLEFAHAHIPGARNLPLFSNEERAKVGTCYKHQGREAAILLGFELMGSRWAQFIRQVEQWQSETGSERMRPVRLHCWRGGMRSGTMAWALNLYGFPVCLLKGGYKAYRHFVRTQFETPWPLLVLGGETGSAKTLTLHELSQQNEAVVDLEDLARHQGSSFGSRGLQEQPSQEQFENLLAESLLRYQNAQRIWVENESQRIGCCAIPQAFYQQMRDAVVIDLQVPREARVDFLVEDYGQLPLAFLAESVQRIAKRFGPNETKLSLQALHENRLRDFISQVLVYYDKTYHHSRQQRPAHRVFPLPVDGIYPKQNAEAILRFIEQHPDLLSPPEVKSIPYVG